LLLFFGLGAAWLVRRRGRGRAANLTTAFTMAGFILAANLAFEMLSLLAARRVGATPKEGDRR